MFDSKDLVAESSELIKIHKIEIFSEIAYAVFTLNEIFIYKGNQNKDLSTYTCIFKWKWYIAICLDEKITKNYWYEKLGINETITTCDAGKLRLGYPKSITPEEIPF